MNIQEQGLTLYVGKSLAEFPQNSRQAFEALKHFNTDVYRYFEIEEFLRRLNKAVFNGKGMVRPPLHSYTLLPNSPEGKQSRFANLFNIKGEISQAILRAELRVKKSGLEIQEERKFFDELGINIAQGADLTSEVYRFYVQGTLYWLSKREHDGNWNSKPIYLKSASGGRIVSFPFYTAPSLEDISKTLFEQVGEVLKGLTDQNLIPEFGER